MIAAIIIFTISWMYRALTEDLIPYARIQRVYTPVNGSVVETAINQEQGDKGTTLYHPRVRLRYEVGTEMHEEWCRLDWSSSHSNRDEAVTDVRKYPVGAVVPAWYDPEQPNRIVVNRELGWKTGLISVGEGLVLLSLCIFRPIILIWRKAWKHFRFEQTTGRIIAAEICEKPAKYAASVTLYQPIFTVDYDWGPTTVRATIEGGAYPERSAAEAEILVLLARWPLGTDLALWFNRAAPVEVAFDFDHLTLTRAAALTVLALGAPVIALRAIQVPGSMRMALKARHAVPAAVAIEACMTKLAEPVNDHSKIEKSVGVECERFVPLVRGGPAPESPATVLFGQAVVMLAIVILPLFLLLFLAGWSIRIVDGDQVIIRRIGPIVGAVALGVIYFIVGYRMRRTRRPADGWGVCVMICGPLLVAATAFGSSYVCIRIDSERFDKRYMTSHFDVRFDELTGIEVVTLVDKAGNGMDEDEDSRGLNFMMKDGSQKAIRNSRFVKCALPDLLQRARAKGIKVVERKQLGAAR